MDHVSNGTEIMEDAYEYIHSIKVGLEDNMRKVISELSAQIKALRKQGLYEATVVTYSSTDATDAFYTPDSVKIVCPDLGIGFDSEVYAKVMRPTGRLDMPPIGSKGMVCFTMGDIGNGFFFPANPIMQADQSLEDGKDIEPLGFVNGLIPELDLIGGKYAVKALEEPSKYRILESSDKFIFYEDYEEQEVGIRVADGWDLRLIVGDGGALKFDMQDELLDAPLGGADVLMDSGLSGNYSYETVNGDYTLSTVGGNYLIETTAGNIDIVTTAGKIDISAGVAPTQKALLGKDTVDLLRDILTAIQALTVPTSVGPSGTPLNASDFANYASQLDDLLSADFTHN